MIGVKTYTQYSPRGPVSLSGAGGGAGNWWIATSIPANDYYGFIESKMVYVSAVLLGAVVISLVVSLYLAWKEQWSATGIVTVERHVVKGTHLICVFGIILYILWITANDSGVNEVATDGLDDVSYQFQEWMTYKYQALVQCNNFTSGLHTANILALSTGEPATNTALDSHFVKMLRIHAQMQYGGADALLVGFHNGDLLGAVLYGGESRVAVRSPETGGDLVYYATKGSGASLQRDTTAEVARFVSYSSITAAWYQAGVTQGQMNHSQFGVDGLMAMQRWEDNRFGIAVTQPFYTSVDNSTAFGVLCARTQTEKLLSKLQVIVCSRCIRATQSLLFFRK